MIIVTGASRGLGKAICERLSANGREVLGLARSEIRADYPTRTCDVTCYDARRALAGELRQGAPVEAVVNAAGIASMNLAITTPEATTRQIIETNLLGTIFACQTFAPLMVRRKAGRIVNFSTIAVALALKGESIYVAAKAGVEGSPGVCPGDGRFRYHVNALPRARSTRTCSEGSARSRSPGSPSGRLSEAVRAGGRV